MKRVVLILAFSASALANHRLWSAVCIVESHRDAKAVGDHGQAVVIAQIRPAMVEEGTIHNRTTHHL